MDKNSAITVSEKHKTAIGVIAEVHGSVVKIACEHLPPLHQSLKVFSGEDTYVLEVHQHIDQTHVRAITLHRAAGLQRGMPVYDEGAPLHIPVSPKCLGRLLNAFKPAKVPDRVHESAELYAATEHSGISLIKDSTS